MRRKVARAQGVRSEDEKEALNARIVELTRTLEARSNDAALLTASVRRAEDDLASARKRQAEILKDTAHGEAQLRTLALECDSAARAAKASGKTKEERMVAHDLLALDARRVREALNAKAGFPFLPVYPFLPSSSLVRTYSFTSAAWRTGQEAASL